MISTHVFPPLEEVATPGWAQLYYGGFDISSGVWHASLQHSESKDAQLVIML